jgi:hypothetical protein
VLAKAVSLGEFMKKREGILAIHGKFQACERIKEYTEGRQERKGDPEPALQGGSNESNGCRSSKYN